MKQWYPKYEIPILPTGLDFKNNTTGIAHNELLYITKVDKIDLNSDSNKISPELEKLFR